MIMHYIVQTIRKLEIALFQHLDRTILKAVLRMQRRSLRMPKAETHSPKAVTRMLKAMELSLPEPVRMRKEWVLKL